MRLTKRLLFTPRWSTQLVSGSVQRCSYCCNKYNCNYRAQQNHFLQRPLSSDATDRAPRGKHAYDVVIVGGGIVGAATAREIQTRYPMLKLALVEKEADFAVHQSGNSSGVIHAGIYYQPGSLMAKLCVDGLHRMYAFCEKHDITHSRCGKLIVATEDSELSRLETLYERAKINNVPDVRLVEKDQIKDIEPYCQGRRAIHSPHTGIADYAGVTKKLASLFTDDGGQTYLEYEVCGFGSTDGNDGTSVSISGKGKDFQLRTRYVIACGGLYSDKLAVMSGCDPLPKIVPFRGDYLVLNKDKQHLVKGNIYPVPDPKFPFLGFHFTPRTNGDIWLGPNAVLAFKREGYKWYDFSLKDFTEAVMYRGLRRLVLKNFSYAASELYYGINLKATVKRLQRFIPEVTTADVTRGPAGVRAQALAEDGSLVGDFLFDEGQGEVGTHILHVRNAPSPAATSSLAIAEMVIDEAEKRFKFKTCKHDQLVL